MQACILFEHMHLKVCLPVQYCALSLNIGNENGVNPLFCIHDGIDEI